MLGKSGASVSSVELAGTESSCLQTNPVHQGLSKQEQHRERKKNSSSSAPFTLPPYAVSLYPYFMGQYFACWPLLLPCVLRYTVACCSSCISDFNKYIYCCMIFFFVFYKMLMYFKNKTSKHGQNGGQFSLVWHLEYIHTYIYVYTIWKKLDCVCLLKSCLNPV